MGKDIRRKRFLGREEMNTIEYRAKHNEDRQEERYNDHYNPARTASNTGSVGWAVELILSLQLLVVNEFLV